jgi:hypothetical protein
MSHAHKFWSLAIVLITWGLLFLAFRMGGLTLEKLRPWGALLCLASLGAWIVLFAMDNPYADFDMAFLLSFAVAVEWIAWFERRSRKPAA